MFDRFAQGTLDKRQERDGTRSCVPQITPTLVILSERPRGRGGLPYCLAVAVALVFPADGFAQGLQQVQVHPCTPSEVSISFSPEAKQLIAKVSDNTEGSPFVSCEALHISWLPSAQIVRFHTPIHVDYSVTFTFLRTSSGSQLWMIPSGEGMYVSPAPDKGIAAMNSLLATAHVPISDDDLSALANVYFFLLDREDGRGPFFATHQKQSSTLSSYPTEVESRHGVRVVRVDSSMGAWQLVFANQKGATHLDSVGHVNANKDN